MTRLTTSESLMLDVIRVVAAAVVALGHLTQSTFSKGWPDLTPLARCSVAVFFLLSGFVIRYVTCGRPTTLGHYLGDRASRIYSIALPALLFTLVADTISRHVNPGFYAPWEADYTHPLRAIATNLFFCGQLWTHIVSPLSNSPFWSVNYEVAYYILYGCWFYLTGIKRWTSLLAVALIFGPRVLYLAPLWILGCLLHDLYQRWNSPKQSAAGITWLTLGVMAGLGVMIHHVALFINEPQNHPMDIVDRIATSSGVWNNDYLFGLVWALVFLALLWLARQLVLQPGTRFARSLHFIAEGTFPIYLLHFPLYVLIGACVPYNHASLLAKLTVFFSVLGIGILCGHPGNILKNKLRSISLFPARPSLAPQRIES